MNKQKLIFLDIDGTIYNDSAQIMDSTRAAIKQARENGHKIIFNTGRIKAALPEDVLELEHDGFITSAGAHVEIGNRCILDMAMGQKELYYIYNYFRDNKILFNLENNAKIFHGYEINDLQDKAINKVVFYDSVISVAQIKSDIGTHCNVIGVNHHHSSLYHGEIFIKNVNKATGIQVITEYYAANREDTVAFGDALIDLEMLQYAGIGVAMENAHSKVKQIADRITKDNNSDGIYHGFIECGLINAVSALG